LQDAAAECPEANQVLITIDKPVLIDIHANITVVEARDWLLDNSEAQSELKTQKT